MRGYAKLLTLFLLHFFGVSNSAEASCFTRNANERLENFCLLTKASSSTISLNEAFVIDARLKREGYARGLGVRGLNDFKTNSLDFSIHTSMQFDRDINGGNPKKPFAIGNLVFLGNPDFYRKEGLVGRLGVGASGRYIYGEGRYLSYNLGASYAHSPEFNLGIKTAGISICSNNHIKSWWYLDGCANTSITSKDLSDERSGNISLKASHIYSNPSKLFSQFSFGVNIYFDDQYVQDQLIFGLDSIDFNNTFTKFQVLVGESVKGELATRLSVSGSLTKIIANKPLTVSASISQSDGGAFFGVDHEERAVLVTVSYPLWKNIHVSLGYRQVDSTIDYFNEKSPIVGIQFNPIRF